MLQIQTLQGFGYWITRPQRAATPADVDFGSDWFRTEADRNDYYEHWRVGWLSATHELYAVKLIGDEYIVIGTFSLDEANARVAARQCLGDPDFHNLDKLLANDPAPEPQEVIEHHGDAHGGFYTTSLFWDCSCDERYIHPFTRPDCPACCDCREDIPDACVMDVLRQASEMDKDLITRLEESLEFIGLDIYDYESWYTPATEERV